MVTMRAELPFGHATWETLGELRLDDAGQLVFPPAPERPGFYRFVVYASGRPTAAYIGETGRAGGLRARFRHYRQRGKTPLAPPGTTSLNAAAFKRCLAGGERVRLDILDDTVVRDGSKTTIDATTKKQRLRIEAVLLEELRSSGLTVFNK